jgi:hypothetical protein
MEWLTQNWIWLALGIGAVLMMRRGAHGGHGGHGGCCSGSATASRRNGGDAPAHALNEVSTPCQKGRMTWMQKA